jgi:hypothetical protein
MGYEPLHIYIGLMLVIHDVSSVGVVKGTLTMYQTSCAGTYRMQGRYHGSELRRDPEKFMSPMTLNALFKRLGYAGKFTPHGVRATASTALNEAGFRSDVIERQLSHVERDDVRRAYNRADYLMERREMMDYWAKLIDSLMAGGKVIRFRAAARAA